MNVNKFLKKFGSMVNEEKLTDYQIWHKANYNISPYLSIVLSDHRVSTLRGQDGNTPLHVLALRGIKEVLKHPDVSEVKNRLGNTPLHLLAWKGVKEAYFHHDFDKIKNKDDETPKDWWIYRGHKPPNCVDFAG